MQTVQIIIQAGALGVLLVVLWGVYQVLFKSGPAAKEFVNGLVATQKEISASQAALVTKQAVTDTKLDALAGSLTTLTGAVNKLTDNLGAATTHVADTVHSEGHELQLEVRAAEERITAAVRREQAEQPPSSGRSPLRRAQ